MAGEAWEVLHGGRFGGGVLLLLEELAAADAERPLGDVVGCAAGVEAEEVEEEAGVDGGGGDPEGGAGEAGHLVVVVGVGYVHGLIEGAHFVYSPMWRLGLYI